MVMIYENDEKYWNSTYFNEINGIEISIIKDEEKYK